jgi:hypothetical protein
MDLFMVRQKVHHEVVLEPLCTLCTLWFLLAQRKAKQLKVKKLCKGEPVPA